jgi:hypothetical protein
LPTDALIDVAPICAATVPHTNKHPTRARILLCITIVFDFISVSVSRRQPYSAAAKRRQALPLHISASVNAAISPICSPNSAGAILHTERESSSVSLRITSCMSASSSDPARP